MSDFLQPSEVQNSRLPCPSPTPRTCLLMSILSQWCYPIIYSSVVPFSSCLQSCLASESFHELVLRIRWPTYWSFSISSSNEYSELISFRIDCFDLFAVQGTLKSLLQHHSSKASILWQSAFFMVQLSHRYMTTGKSIAFWFICDCSFSTDSFFVIFLAFN